jgi:hypothetical protein
MADLEDMLDAHVRFELTRWQGQVLGDTVAEEVSAAYRWLEGVPLAELLDCEAVADAAVEVLCRLEFESEALAEYCVAAVLAARDFAGGSDAQLAEMVSHEQFGSVAAAGIGLTGVRTEVIAQVTTSEVYANLMSHVLYQGIKNYVQTENPVAKKVPGAAALMRFGQNAVNAAAPKLEQGIDRQLTAFVAASVADTIKDSQAYLTRVMTPEVLGTVAEEVWQTNAGQTLSDLAALVPSEQLEPLTLAVLSAALQLRSTDVAEDAVRAMVADFFAGYGDHSVAAMLAGAGLPAAKAAELLVPVAAAALASPAAAEYLAVRIRARLEAFYTAYAAGLSG